MLWFYSQSTTLSYLIRNAVYAVDIWFGLILWYVVN